MGAFAGISSVRPTSGGQYFEEGEFVVEIDAIKQIDGFKGKSFIVETTVAASSNPKCPPGSHRSWVVNVGKSKYPELALGNIKAFVIALCECDETAIDEPGILALCGTPCPAKGKKMGLTVNVTKNKTTAGEFSHHHWRPLESGEETAQQVDGSQAA